MSNIDKQAVTAKTKELSSLMVERFSMNPVSCKLLNEAWEKEFPDEVAIAKRMLALLDELEAAEKRIAELEAPAPELKMAHLINKFYERYPLAEFKSDTERSAALGYFMAGAELQCFGEFINYAELMGDE